MNSNQKRKRHPFTPEEDKKLRELVDLYGEQNWSLISGHMMNRTVRQCRDRWTNSLSGNVIKGEWSAEEDALLLQLFKENGSRWKSMEKFFPGRAQYDIRNHCKSIVNQKLYAFNFFNQSKIASSTVKNKTKSIHMAKNNPPPLSLRQSIPFPDLKSNGIENSNDFHFQNASQYSFSSEKDFQENLLQSNTSEIQNLSIKKQIAGQPLDIANTRCFNNSDKNAVDDLTSGKFFINLNKIDPILVPFISEPMLLHISSS